MSGSSESEEFPGRLLHQAALWDNIELLQDLLQDENEAKLVNSLDSWGRTPIHAAALTNDSKCLPLLISFGGNVNAICGSRGDCKTPLHLSAEHGHCRNIEILIDSGADLLVKDANGLTPLELARHTGHNDCENMLESALDAREQVRLAKHNELREAVNTCSETLVKSLIDALGCEKTVIVNMAPSGANTLLFLASQSGNENIVKLLIDADADGRSHAVTKYSPLHIAVHNGNESLTKLILSKFPELIQQLTVERWSPLHAACINGHVELVSLLLGYAYPDELYSSYRDETGEWEWRLAFDPNVQDVTGQTALYIACLLGNKALTDVLLNWRVSAYRTLGGDDKTVATKPPIKKVSPAKKRISFGIQSIMSRLSMQQDEDNTTTTENMRSPLQLDLLCGAPRETALLASVRGGYIDLVVSLLQCGANPNIIARPLEDQNDPKNCNEIYGLANTPLIEAVSQKALNIVELLLSYDAKDNQSIALGIACSNNDEKIICKLLSKRAFHDPDYKINKKHLTSEKYMENARPSNSNITYSSLFPNTPTMINWHSGNCKLTNLKMEWFMDAVYECNPRLKGQNKLNMLALDALTRIDISHNALITIPVELFNLCSLRCLNLAQNKLQHLPKPESYQPSDSPRRLNSVSKTYNCPVLEEIYLQDNRLESIPPALFNLPSLIIIDASNNKLQELPHEMWRSPKLKELNVAFNLLKDLPYALNDQIAKTMDPISPAAEAYYFNQLSGDAKQAIRERTVIPVEMDRHHIWPKSLEITDQEIRLSDNKSDDQKSQLQHLNLANNLFTSIPIGLPCLAVNLTRLSMSYNSLRSMGHVTSYPASLKQLDLSHNEISCWPSLPRITLSDPHLACYNYQEDKSNSAKSSPRNSGLVSSTSISSDLSSGKAPPPTSNSISSFRNAVLKTVCSHRRHLRLESLRTLVLADNLLTRIQLSTDDVATLNDVTDDSEWSLVGISKSRLIFPNLSMLDISNNCLKEIPTTIHELSNLSVLNLSGNIDIQDLPANMGLLSRLWNLNTRGCSLQDPLRSMIESKKYKTMDIIGYLKSVYEDAKPYARMKLMVVGVQGIGKTSLLELLRQENPSKNKKSVDHWAKRMGHKNINTKTSRGINMSTVGVDIGDWVCEKKIRGQSQHGAVTFRTWDFGGQKEYYATHQYFLSKRSLYIVVWRINDGKKGLAEVHQWLGNIQARAPNSPVIIVGTHYDSVGENYPPEKAEQLQQIIRDRFINVSDAEKLGLPKILDSVEVSCKTHHNIKILANLIYDTAFSLRPPGSKEPLLYQKVPASYLALEDVVGIIAAHLKEMNADPVLNAERYKQTVTEVMQQHNCKLFRDLSELNQATMFLHDNGVLLHYDDSTLRDLYFLDPQWLCDMLAHVVTVREINPFARSGVMKMDDLQHVFKNSCLGSNSNRSYVVSLLNKFEVALSWDTRTLLIPSLLPVDEESQNLFVKLPVRTKHWTSRQQMEFVIEASEGKSPKKYSEPYSSVSQNDETQSIVRLLLMSYFPSGFWSRLITRILADDQMVEAVRNIYILPKNFPQDDGKLMEIACPGTQWSLWQTGLALHYGETLIFRMREIPMNSIQSPYRNSHNRFKLKQDGVWCDVDIANSCILEIYFPLNKIGICKNLAESGDNKPLDYTIEVNYQSIAQLLALSVDHIDLLLEDWYPTLGTRFVHTSEGRFLITRLVPCLKCLSESEKKQSETLNERKSKLFTKMKRLSMDRNEGGDVSGLNEIFSTRKKRSQDSLGWSDGDSGVGPDSVGSSRTTSVEGHPNMTVDNLICLNYTWMIEECILASCDKKSIPCPAHGEILLRNITPDVVFLDLIEKYLITSDNITRGSLLGRGAFGFVFKAKYKSKTSSKSESVAMKMLQPVPPGPRARESALIAYKAAVGKWDRDPLQHSCKAYCTARQELAVLLTLKHMNVVPLIGVCTQPLALVLDWAPKGALDGILRNFRRSGAKIGRFCFQSLVLQAARAIEYLHRKKVIYRDLKAENVLVWEFPDPHDADSPNCDVHIKVADYGISRISLPSGTKGFGGTEGFMAPEIMRHNGEEEYTEKVDCFSFGMFLYELIALRQPFEGYEAVKECILEGERPMLTQREAQFPCYCLDLMVLCWDQQPKIRPSASQIVSIASAPEFTHLIDVISLAHSGSVLSGVRCPIYSLDDGDVPYEFWLPCSNSRIDLLIGSEKGWQGYNRIAHFSSTPMRSKKPIKFTSATSVGNMIWMGDNETNIYGFNITDCNHLFTYALDPAQQSAVVGILYLAEINRVAVGLENGRLFLLDSTLIPSNSSQGEGSFVLTELGSGETLHSISAVWQSETDCEIWCGENDGIINVFSVKEAIPSGRITLSHYTASFPLRGLCVSLLYTAGKYVYSYISPGCILFMWNAETKEIETRLDCSKLVPCSESLKSISIEEHLSPGKCQISSLAVLQNNLYIGTSWGCIIVAEKHSLRPITIFRPYDDEVRIILPIPEVPGTNSEFLVTIGRGYRSLIQRFTDITRNQVTTPINTEKSMLASLQKDHSTHMHALLWRTDNWNPI